MRSISSKVNPNLAAGARNAVETCLAIQPDESVALIFDEPSREVATSLADALAKRDANWTGYCVEDYAKRPLAGTPKEILAALEHVERRNSVLPAAVGRTHRATRNRRAWWSGDESDTRTW